MVDGKENYKFDLGVKGLNFLGSMSVSKQLRTYTSPDESNISHRVKKKLGLRRDELREISFKKPKAILQAKEKEPNDVRDS